MKTNLDSIISDLGLDRPFIKGQNIPVKNCWHFSTDGNAVDVMFYDDADFIAGMNRIYITVRGYKVVILAFSLMDTHVHFVLYGDFDECNRFMHDYVRRTSKYISLTHGEKHKLEHVPINHQAVTDDFYLKIVICYTIKNAPVGGIPCNAWDYPWSSGPLYFRRSGYWSSPAWLDNDKYQGSTSGLGSHKLRAMLKTMDIPTESVHMSGPIIFPGVYVAYELVEKIFKTCKSFSYFMCITKEEDVDSKGGIITHLSVPMQEMRQHKNELCMELFGVGSIKTLNMQQRLRMARVLKSRYNSSVKQIARLCGLVYEETKGLI